MLDVAVRQGTCLIVTTDPCDFFHFAQSENDIARFFVIVAGFSGGFCCEAEGLIPRCLRRVVHLVGTL